MLFKIAIQDYFEFIKKNKVLFFLVSVGLFAVSFLSLLLLDTIRYNFLRDITYEGNHNFTYVYTEPISGKELYNKLKRVDLSICDVHFVSEQANANDPETTESALKTRTFTYNSGKITDAEELGIVGYSNNLFMARAQTVFQGRFFNYTDNGKMNAVVNSGFVEFEDNGYISAEGYSFNIIGKTSTSGGSYMYDKSSILIPLKTFADLDVNVKVVYMSFQIPPTKGYLNKVTNILESFGENENSNQDMGVFSISIILAAVPASMLQILSMVFVMLILILVFKCWINSQQSVYKIYSICGISDMKLLGLRYIQVCMMFIPMYIISSACYIALVLGNYKRYVYNLLPLTFVFNFILILAVLIVMITVQNRRNTGYQVLNHI